MKEKKHRILMTIAGLTLLINLAACGGDDQAEKEHPAPKEPTVTEAVVTDQTADEPAVDLEFWNRDWYGIWVVIDGDGACEQYIGMENSCCATILIEDSGEGMFLSWDYTGNRSDYNSQLCNAMLTLKQDEEGDYTQASKGWFWDEALPEDWSILKAERLKGWESYTDAIVVTNLYHVDGGDAVGQFEYIIFLRPWGADWSDLEAEAPHMLPPDYYDWYLPLVETGTPMPDSYE